MNPFENKEKISNTPEMKALFKELRGVTAKICLQYAEEKGEALNMDHVHRSIHAATDFDIIMFKINAAAQLAQQPETSLPMSERIAIAGHEAYKKVIEIG